MPFAFKKMELEGVVLVEPKVFGDNRGYFMESYKKSDFTSNGIETNFIQDNHSKSTKGVLRGLHYQTNPVPQAKLVRCTKGCIFDVAVDIRKNSKTFKQWIGVELSEDNKKMLFIPEGFAHGFLVLSDEAELQYKVSAEYSPKNDKGIKWDDPDIGIDWGVNFSPIISEKDSSQPLLKNVKGEDLF